MSGTLFDIRNSDYNPLKKDHDRQQHINSIQDIKNMYSNGEKVSDGNCQRCFQYLAFVPTVTLECGHSFCLWCQDSKFSKCENCASPERKPLSVKEEPLYPKPPKAKMEIESRDLQKIPPRINSRSSFPPLSSSKSETQASKKRLAKEFQDKISPGMNLWSTVPWWYRMLK